MSYYKVLDKQKFSNGQYIIEPIRNEDRHLIREWRNEQIYHLRQRYVLSELDQDRYFDEVVSELFVSDAPNQILFSYLENGVCLGYGGLVHINWVDRHAEVSFIMNTSLEKTFFKEHWSNFLNLLQEVAFNELNFHKIFTYAYDVRPRLYEVLEDCGFCREAVLKDHCFFYGRFVSVIIHSKINYFSLRKATLRDEALTHRWAASKSLRSHSFNRHEIGIVEHRAWFQKKLQDVNCIYLILDNTIGNPVGSIRIDMDGSTGLISYLVDEQFQGRGLGQIILTKVIHYLEQNKLKISSLVGYVMNENIASIKTFEKLGFLKERENTNFKFQKDI